MQHIRKQLHFEKFTAFELLCNSLCGSLTKTFGDPVIHQVICLKFRVHFIDVLF